MKKSFKHDKKIKTKIDYLCFIYLLVKGKKPLKSSQKNGKENLILIEDRNKISRKSECKKELAYNSTSSLECLV